MHACLIQQIHSQLIKKKRTEVHFLVSNFNSFSVVTFIEQTEFFTKTLFLISLILDSK